MGNFIRAANRHHWFNPANQQKALKLAMRIEKRLERDPEAYPGVLPVLGSTKKVGE